MSFSLGVAPLVPVKVPSVIAISILTYAYTFIFVSYEMLSISIERKFLAHISIISYFIYATLYLIILFFWGGGQRGGGNF